MTSLAHPLLTLPLFLLVIPWISTQSLCPDARECYCYTSGYEIRADCTGPDIIVVSPDLPDNLTELYISYSNLEVLLSGNLSKYTDLRQIELVENEYLTTIESGAFELLDFMEIFVGLHNAITSIPTDTLPDTLQELYLQDNYLSTVPSLTGLTELEIVNLDNNQITEIHSNTFASNGKLTAIFVSYNSIGSIATDAFDSLSNLQTLHIDNNRIPSIEPGDFNGLSKLQVLSFTNNMISELVDGAFSGIGSDSLTELDLSYNQITSISDDVFSTFTSLMSLYLTGNKLTTVPTALIAPPSLEFLDLSANLLEVIGGHAFAGMLSLNTLSIGDMDSLSSLSDQAFSGLPNLRILSLYGNTNLINLTLGHLPDSELEELQELRIFDNGFTSLDEDIFANKVSLQRVDLVGNPLHCDCVLQWMVRVIEEDIVWAREWVSNTILCASPSHLQAFNIPAMKRQDLSCDLPDVEPTYSGGQDRVVAFLHGNATLMAEGIHGIPMSWWVTPSGVEYVPIRKNPTLLTSQEVTVLEDYDITPSHTVVVASLLFKNTSLSDAGVYKVWMSNHRGNVSTDVILEVLPYEETVPPLPTTVVGIATHLATDLSLTGMITVCVVVQMLN